MSNYEHADLSSHDTFIGGVPHETFTYLRKECPIFWTKETDGSGKGFWSFTRHEDIVQANLNFKTFSSSLGIRIEEMQDDELQARRTLMEMDPPDHTKLRRLVGRGFTRKVVRTYEQAIRDIAVRVIDEALKKSEFDAVGNIARQVPMLMLGRLLGVPEEHAEWLVTKGDEMIGNTDSDYTDHVVDQVDTDEFRLYPFRSPAGKEMFEYSEKLAADKRINPTDDISSLLLQPTEDGEPLNDHDFKNMFTLAAAAGNDTTRYSISSSIKVLADHPVIFQQLKTFDEEQWDVAIEELMRWASPTMHFRRTALDDINIRDTKINKGDKIVLWFVSGNRDESVFNDPFNIDITRSPNPHMAFGRGGPHSCMGLWLAKMELKMVLQYIVERVKSIEQTDHEKYLRSNFISGIKWLPINVTLN